MSWTFIGRRVDNPRDFMEGTVSTSKSMVKCKINVDTDFTDYTDFHNHYQSV